nr:MAG: hypothetical protein 1 [Leviviridae sp.]
MGATRLEDIQVDMTSIQSRNCVAVVIRIVYDMISKSRNPMRYFSRAETVTETAWAGDSSSDESVYWDVPVSGLSVVEKIPYLGYRPTIHTITNTEVHAPYSNYCEHRECPLIPDTFVEGSYYDTRLTADIVRDEGEGKDKTPYFRSWSSNFGAFRQLIGLSSLPFNIVPPHHTNHRDVATAAISVMSGEGDQGTALMGLMNQILEMKDLPQLLKSVLGFIRFLRALGSKEVVRLGPKKLASSYLAVQYGVIPTIGQVDYFINTLPKALSEFQSRWTQLRTNYRNVPKLFSVRKNILTDDWHPDYLAINRLPNRVSFSRTYSATGTWSGEEHWRQLLHWLQERVEIYSDSEVTHDLVYAQFMTRKFLQLDIADHLFAIIWDIISPFQNFWAVTKMSFVADWFVSIDQVAKRLDNLIVMADNADMGVDTVDGTCWRSRRFVPWVGTNMWRSFSMNETITPSYSIINGVRRVTSLHVEQTFSGDSQPTWRRIEGKFYSRSPMSLSVWDIVLPSWHINLNLSKLISLIAIGIGFT